MDTQFYGNAIIRMIFTPSLFSSFPLAEDASMPFAVTKMQLEMCYSMKSHCMRRNSMEEEKEKGTLYVATNTS